MFKGVAILTFRNLRMSQERKIKIEDCFFLLVAENLTFILR